MFFSSKLLEELLEELIHSDSLKQDTVSNMIYHLKLPGQQVAKYLASLIASKSCDNINNFPKRLAFGVLDDSLLIYDISKRYNNNSKLCKKIDFIDLNLKKLDYPISITRLFDSGFSVFLFALEATQDLALPSNEPSNAELASLTERVLESFIIENEITKTLLSKVVNNFEKEQKNRLETRISRSIKDGMKNEPWSDSSKEIFSINEPIRFRESMKSMQDFENYAWKTIEEITLICRQ